MKRILAFFVSLFIIISIPGFPVVMAAKEELSVVKSKTYLGVDTVPKTPVIGIEITKVEEKGLAFEAGIREGDILIRINDMKTKSLKKAKEAWVAQDLESVVELVLIRRGSKYTTGIKKDVGFGLLGMSFPDDTYGNARVGEGITVTNIIPGSPAEKAGIKKNDVIVGFNQKPTLHPNILNDLVSECSEREIATLEYIREKEKFTTDVKLETARLEVSGIETIKDLSIQSGDTRPLFTITAKGDLNSNSSIGWYKILYLDKNKLNGLGVGFDGSNSGLRIENTYDEKNGIITTTLWADDITIEDSGEYGIFITDLNNLRIDSPKFTIIVY